MIQVFPAESRYVVNHGWLKSSFSFSFSEYYDSENIMFGPLRVLNDDSVAAHRGFAMHPHHEMEIVSIVLSGYLKHEDSYGNSAITSFGEVQRMSAGTGIFHSEVNPAEEEVNFLQLWFLPKEEGIVPSYEKASYNIDKMKNALLPVVSYQSSEEVAYIHQDLTIYLSDLDIGKTLSFSQQYERKTFVFVIEGELILHEDIVLGRRDSARITNMTNLRLASDNGARFMLIDLP
jgi:redox-sensitive bicupin YhaK (pirin superfamily)